LLRSRKIEAVISEPADQQGHRLRRGSKSDEECITGGGSEAHQPPPGQVTSFADPVLIDSAVPDPSATDGIATELEVLSTKVDGHVRHTYRPMLHEIGITKAEQFPGPRFVVEGVRVAIQTPPMRSGKKTAFISLDDGTGCIDITLFEEAQL